MHIVQFLILVLSIAALIPQNHATAAETEADKIQKEWQLSAGAGLIFAPAFTGAVDENRFCLGHCRF
ncbi:MAG: hypothetical protein ACOYL3_18635 [Desulfuromonadaceae bacterium]